jgi:hypothetical protein
MGNREASRKWRQRMQDEGRCTLCGGLWDGETRLCDPCRQRASEQRAARSVARMERFRALGQEPRTRGAGGFAAHPEHRYRCSHAEHVVRARRASAASAMKRQSSVKWKSVAALLEACKSGVRLDPTWALVADLYDLAYSRGYAAGKAARFRPPPSSEAKDSTEAA